MSVIVEAQKMSDIEFDVITVSIVTSQHMMSPNGHRAFGASASTGRMAILNGSAERQNLCICICITHPGCSPA